MAINPIAFARAVNEQFLRYQLTAFPIADEALARQAEESIRGVGARPTPLIKGPYLSLAKGFRCLVPTGTGSGKTEAFLASFISFSTPAVLAHSAV